MKDMGASIRQRLKNKSRKLNIPFDQILQRYGIERFLLRLSESVYREKFILKGGQMLLVWDDKPMRPTMDIDFMGITENSLDNLKDIMLYLCGQNCPDVDGIIFDTDSIDAVRMKEDAEYEGVRVTFEGLLDTARIHMQIDTGFNDAITPDPEIMRYPSLLGQVEPELRVYHRETLIAEKYEAMVKLGEFNSRMKDFFDIWLLSSQFSFEERVIGAALNATFERRGTSLDQQPSILDPHFEHMNVKQTQWSAFIRKNNLTCAPKKFSDVAASIALFMNPVLNALLTMNGDNRVWTPLGPWSEEL